MAKKIIAGILTVLLAIGVCFAVCSCGEGDDNSNGGSVANTQSGIVWDEID
jgi:hypothetical protein